MQAMYSKLLLYMVQLQLVILILSQEWTGEGEGGTEEKLGGQVKLSFVLSYNQ